MSALTQLSSTLGSLPLDYLILFVALGAIALAGFAIHSVCTIVRERQNDDA